MGVKTDEKPEGDDNKDGDNKPEGDSKNQDGDNKPEGDSKNQDGDNKPNLLSVDLFGEKINLPYDVAKRLIEKRDERTSVFRDLQQTLEKHDKDLQDARRRAEAAERAKEGNLAEAEALFSQKHQSKIDRYKTVTVNTAIRAALLSDELFVGGESATKDAMALLRAEGDWDVSDDLEVTSRDGKKVQEAVAEFVKSRENFQKQSRKPPAIDRNNQSKSSRQHRAAGRYETVKAMGAALAKRGIGGAG